MRILIVVHGFPPAAQGGAEIYAHAQASALRRLFGDDVLVLTRDQDSHRPEYELRTEEYDGLRVVRINNTFRNVRSFEESYRNETIGAMAGKVIDDFHPDVAHIHHLTCLSTTIVRALRTRDVPIVLTLHDYWLLCHRGQLLDAEFRVCDGPAESGCQDRPPCESCLGTAGGAGALAFAGAALVRGFEGVMPPVLANPARRVASAVGQLAHLSARASEQSARRVAHMREVCADVTHFLAPSVYMRERFLRFGIQPDRISLSPYGFDHRPFGSIRAPLRQRRDGARPLQLGFLGSLMVSKAPHLIIEAMRQLPQGSVSLDVYGAPSAYHGDDSYRSLIEPLLDEPAVRSHGHLTHDGVPKALASMDALIVPSIWPENSPLVIQEAFLAGRPVVASNIGGIPEVVTHGTSGLLFEPENVDDLARALRSLVEEIDLLPRLRKGLPEVRTIEDDVLATRARYQSLIAAGSTGVENRIQPPRQESPQSRTTAVILNYRAIDQTIIAVRSLLASRHACDIIVVDNDGPGSTSALREALLSLPANITYVATGRNLGFSGGMNAGIREALSRGAQRVLLVNSDVVVPPDTIEHLLGGFAIDERAGIAGPVILARSEPDRIASLGMSYAPAFGRMKHAGSGDLLRTPVSNRPVDGVSGCFMAVRREVFDAIGLLDEDYFFSFEDLAFCLRARDAGFSTLLVGNAVVYHEGGQSIGPVSPERLYFAARNHLLLADRVAPNSSALAKIRRTLSIVALNAAHALRANGGSIAARLGAVARGTRDYAAGRFGSGGRSAD